jgi:Uma2 family endonuclease
MATSALKPTEAAAPATPSIPRLENGDRLTRAEFERRYDAMPGLNKAELIEGIVYMPSPVRFAHHGRPHLALNGWLLQYLASTPGVEGADNGSIRLDLDNMPQPDAFLLILPSHGGQAHISEDDYVERAPELIAEVSASSVSFDLNTKFQVYRRSGVREYVVWRVDDRAIDWFVLREGRFDRLALSPAGFYRSEVFPGLWLDPAALVGSDLLAVLQVGSQGLASPEHAAFVAALQARETAAGPIPPPA